MIESQPSSKIEASSPNIQTPEKTRQEKGIKPITKAEVERRIVEQYKKIGTKEKYYLSYCRGVKEYLYDESTYAMLPGYGDHSTEELINKLSVGSKILDVACGNGTFLHEVRSVNDKIIPYGYDGIKRDMKIDKDHFVEGKINDLAPETYYGMRFDLVTNVATSYHAEDFFGGGLQAMTSMLEKDGLLLVSSLPRTVRMLLYKPTNPDLQIMYDENLIENNKGKIANYITNPLPIFFESGNKYNLISSRNMWSEGRCAGVFRPDGTIVTPAEYFSFLQKESNNAFNFEYSVAYPSTGDSKTLDGKLAVQKRYRDAELNLKNVFYATMDMEIEEPKQPSDSLLAYIIAETPQQAQELSDHGFVSVGAVDRETRILQIVKEGIIGKTVEEIKDSRYSPAAIAKLREKEMIQITDEPSPEQGTKIYRYSLPK